MRYRLATYRECKAHREWNTTCPDCGRRGKFSPYIDIATMQPVDDKRCGRCSRLSNCGYHLPPREMPRTEDYGSRASRERRENPGPENYASHRSHKSHRSCIAESSQLPSGVYTRRSRQQGRSDLPFREICEICVRQKEEFGETNNSQREASEFYEKMRRACEQSQPWGSHLVTWLRTKFPREQVDAALKRYRVGGTPDGATLWWQIDEQGRVHTGKAMLYNPLTGHRVKEQGFPVNWAHRMRRYGEPSELVAPQCLFGLHLINVDVNANDNCHPEDIHREAQSTLSFSSSLALQAATLPLVMLVESEKTALIMSLVCPDKVWLATGGKANFKESMLAPLIGLEVAVYPDADALHDWYTRAVEMNRTLGTHLHIPTGYYNLMDHDETRREGWDLADVVLSS
ncbi:MAG: hypothetical protein E7091_00040 [Bacteroidales bacterium]|nr:hypothetical protein [Bacteroidales bacterium]